MNTNTIVVPNSNHEMNKDIPNMQDIQSEMNKNLDRYKTDSAYRREMLGKMEMASKASGFSDKQAY